MKPVAQGNDALLGALVALAQEHRLAIIQLLAHDGGLSQVEILRRLGGRMRQPSLSHHLRILRQRGLVSQYRDGRRIRYQLRAAELAAALGSLVDELEKGAALGRLPEIAEAHREACSLRGT